ncbi:uncharacterized protein [Pyxicephalus adspersus]|uniref:uncharacterized protein isoform X5 n=1 Tax=Pyxicephalus adspersus TaxID=30357 RepID=UPI003B5C677B
MSEGWEDWPLLGPGWKRRIAIRKSGQSCGHSDTYYQSPTGQRFRSKPELAKFLGESIDLSCFNFKHGTLIPVENRKKSKKKKSTSPVQPKKRLSFALQSPDEHKQNGTETKSMVKCCTGCKSWFSGVEFGQSKQTIWYCTNCCVSRRAFNKVRKFLKPGDCGVCQGCTATDDCESCSMCLKRKQNPELEINNKCMKHSCHNEKPDTKSTNKDFAAKKLKTKWTLMSEKDGRSLSAKNKDGGSWIIGKPETKPIKEEREESNTLDSNSVNSTVKQEIPEEPLNLYCPVKTEEFIAETDDVEAADESTPVITQIFSFATLLEKNGLGQVLQEFLMELHEIPLPAHWEVLSNVGPTLQLVQRSKASTMAETVVHIQPGLHYHIVVREYTVPSFHELFQTHPSRLTTVDEVVELICDLEAYRPCAGLPREGPRSPNCQVLVYGEWCQQCSINPWPSGFVR